MIRSRRHEYRTRNAVTGVYRGAGSIPALRRHGGFRAGRAALHACAPREGIPQEGGGQPEPARPETKERTSNAKLVDHTLQASPEHLQRTAYAPRNGSSLGFACLPSFPVFEALNDRQIERKIRNNFAHRRHVSNFNDGIGKVKYETAQTHRHLWGSTIGNEPSHEKYCHWHIVRFPFSKQPNSLFAGYDHVPPCCAVIWQGYRNCACRVAQLEGRPFRFGPRGRVLRSSPFLRPYR